MADKVNTVADYMEIVKGKTERDFVAAFPHPVLIEKVGIFPHEHASLMSGTMLGDTHPDLERLEAESVDLNIRDAKVFPIRPKEESTGTEIRVGRAPTNDIILPSSSVSRLHAQFIPIQNTKDYQLVDVFASNGTFINGEKVNPFEKPQVNDLDHVSFGPDYLLIFYSPQAFYELLVSLRI